MSSERSITPVLRYRDPRGAAEWLCRALGFKHDHTSEDPGGEAYYISLRLGDCFVLVCPVANSVLHELMVQPAEVGGANTQMCYVTVPDLDAHSTHALAAGRGSSLAPKTMGPAAASMCAEIPRATCGASARKHTARRAPR